VRAGEFKPGEVVPGTRYRVVGLLGAGGMGLVYEVEHLELGKRFVLKALLSNLAAREDIAARLRNEQRALGRLQHPNIVAVTDAGVTSTSIPFFVMERLEGETLGARLKRSRRLPVVEAIGIARGILDGLSVAHEIGVVHRDIKPQNIFLLSGSRPKILDFGIAKIADAASVITARGVAIGTPRYMSPEQVGGESVDGRSDLYAVGLLLFETIAGRGPFDDVRDSNEMLLAHLGKVAPRLGGAATGVTRELDALVASLLAKAPRERPPTARAAAAALGAVLDRYGGGSNLEAPTPLSSYSSTTHPLISTGGPIALRTRPDGVAARDPATLLDPTGSRGTTEVMPHAASDHTAGGGPRGPGGTLYDPSSRALTVPHVLREIPIDALRTEELETASVPNAAADAPTHTRVPAAPNDATPSLVPVRVRGPRAQHGRTLAWLGSVALLFFAIAAYFVLRAGSASSVNATGEDAARSAGAEERRESAQTAGTPVAAPSVPEASATFRAPSARLLPADSSTAAPQASAPHALRASAPKTVERAPSPDPLPSVHGAPSAASSRRATKEASSAAPLPPGLPGSGL
jgi:serine/threonine protein kinase